MKKKTQTEKPGIPPASDDTLRQFVGYNIKRTFNAVHADLTISLQPFGLRMITYSALVLIKDNPGIRQSHLADALNIERPNLVVIIDELVDRSLITRTPVVSDRRANALQTTPRGDSLSNRATSALQAHEKNFLRNLKPGEIGSLIQTLQQIENAVRKE